MSQFRRASWGVLVPGLALAALALVRPAAADTPALGFTAAAVGTPDSAADESFLQGLTIPSYVLGWSFTADQALTVTSLGWDYDPGYSTIGGVVAPDATHAVGLYSSLGTLLTSTTVAYGGAAGFSYAAASPVTLAAGSTYTLAGVTGLNDPFFLGIEDTTQLGNVGLVVNPALTYKQDQIVVGSSLADPTGTDAADLVDPAYFGPNFQFVPQTVTAAVPEASPWALLLPALLPVGLLIAGRREARQ